MRPTLVSSYWTTEPRPVSSVTRPPPRADVAAVFGDIADLKTPFTHGHSSGVAALARTAGEQLGLAAAEIVRPRGRRALLHDVGRVAVSSCGVGQAGSPGRP
jgi:HD-GYP domain-containing protein (c-di-GMP phosphodiesterase class II)